MSEPDVPSPEAPGQEDAAVPQAEAQQAEATQAEPQQAEAQQTPAPVQVRLRRAPRYRVFVLTGALLGALAGIAASALLGDPASLFSPGTVSGYLAAIGLLLGGLAGAAVAVLMDRPGK